MQGFEKGEGKVGGGERKERNPFFFLWYTLCMLSHQKVKSVAKVMVPRGKRLQELIESTLKTCSDLVGSTLGPGGMSVVIERQETGLPPIVTKDGVTVFKSLGFTDPAQQVIMETAREASVRTAAEAGDGTTTATILSESIVTNLSRSVKENPHVSPQMITRRLQTLFTSEIEPLLKSWAMPCDLDKNKQRTWNVARISANGDVAMADAVMECYNLVGDKGNVTITEASGSSEYEVNKIEGFPVSMGYEESCGIFFPEFINDTATQQCILQKPLWILYHGYLSDFNQIFMIAQSVAEAASEGKVSPAIVVVATGFSESFVATCAASFKTQGAVRIFPLLAPRNIQKTAQLDFLEDLAALTGAKVFNPLNAPLDSIQGLRDVGGLPGPTSFECGRFRATVVGYGDEVLVLDRVDEVTRQLKGQSSSDADRRLLNERIAKLTNGIARLVVRGASTGEVKEKRDRAEDAVCAVRAALENGALQGGGLTWVKLANYLNGKYSVSSKSQLDGIVVCDILVPAILSPVYRLFTNAGYTYMEAMAYTNEMIQKGSAFDLSSGGWLSDSDESLLDSFSAVRDALRNSLSVASLLGTCGGTVVFARDQELERREAIESMEYLKAANYNEANERG